MIRGIFLETFEHSIEITLLVFLMMTTVDYFNVRTRGMLTNMIQKKSWRPYVLSSFLGVIPGCFGSFMSVTMYFHGLIGFGALVGTMVATSGDAAYVMLSMFPEIALILFLLLFILGIVFGWLSQKIATLLKFVPCAECQLQEYHRDERGLKHYFTEHLWHHIIKKHLLRIFLWMFSALLFINLALHFWDVDSFVKSHMIWVFLISALIGLIPDSGPHLIFVMLFAKGAIPFSVLLTSSISQDGHGVLPLLSYSVRDTVHVKTYNLLISLLAGGIVYFLGY
ncbi:MAG TPA: selenocysteine protein [Bacteroidetes bacterium]|nr:selenocysteine protein [Bacteroidota bacterium]